MNRAYFWVKAAEESLPDDSMQHGVAALSSSDPARKILLLQVPFPRRGIFKCDERL
jgi:hypothetical protein